MFIVKCCDMSHDTYLRYPAFGSCLLHCNSKPKLVQCDEEISHLCKYRLVVSSSKPS